MKSCCSVIIPLLSKKNKKKLINLFNEKILSLSLKKINFCSTHNSLKTRVSLFLACSYSGCEVLLGAMLLQCSHSTFDESTTKDDLSNRTKCAALQMIL